MGKYLYSNSGYWVIAQDRETGKVAWRRNLRTYFHSVSMGQAIYLEEEEQQLVASWLGGSVALDPITGRVRWHRRPLHHSTLLLAQKMACLTQLLGES